MTHLMTMNLWPTWLLLLCTASFWVWFQVAGKLLTAAASLVSIQAELTTWQVLMFLA